MRIFSHRVLYFTIRGNQLATPRELNFCEIEKKAQKYYDKKFASATDFLFHTKIAYDRKTYPMTSFMLHQATEYFIKTIPLVFALYGHKEHDLDF